MTRIERVSLTERRAAVSHANAAHVWKLREGIVVSLHAGAITGSGEASPLPGYSRDDLPTCRRELEDAARRLEGMDVPADAREALREATRRAGVRAPAAVFAVETAVLDLLGHALAKPAWALLRGDGRASPIALSALAEGATADELARSAEAAVARGIATVKIKIGGAGKAAEDCDRLAAVRARVGDRVGLRLDANQTLSREEIVARIGGLAAFGPELVEEPTATDAWLTLPPLPVPVAMDESLAEDGWTERIVTCAARQTCAAIVLKPTSLGGVLRCLAIADVAERAGMSMIVTHTFDGPIASAAAACLALALRGRVLPCGLDSRHRLERPIAPVTDTHVVPFDAPGIGA